MSTVYAETERFYLRSLDKNELPRLVELLNAWDVAKWLAVLPYPYLTTHAEDFHRDMAEFEEEGAPQFFVIAAKSDNLLLGGIGLHPPRGTNAVEGELEIGYWLGKDYWGKGIMTEAAKPIVFRAFSMPATALLGATTDLNNAASQNVLQKLGLRNQGIALRDYPAFRGPDHIVKWVLTRKEWEKVS
ncbi:MAG: GNAT family protein [Alphaproteobacteria bacterium]|nr:GNAT family protein [Alphaproteobacteria bacterium]